MDKKTKFSVWYIIIAFWVLILLQDAYLMFRHLDEIPYSQFKTLVTQGKVAEVAITPTTIRGQLKPEKEKESPRLFQTVRIEDPDLVKLMEQHQVKFTGIVESTFWRDIASWVIPVIIFFGIWYWIFSRLGQQSGLMRIGQSKAKIYVEKDIPVRFSDVAGVDEAKDELKEVIEFLKTPEKFTRIGGRIPKGILLVGPPGTGKTLLAKAVAGEAGVPFFSISGSEFVEMFVGVGAARVRDLFEQAKEKAPCIIFIDELDALGRARGAGPMAHEEREQTLNQLLVEMDGFDSRTGVILMAATNRPEILDPALLRAGRFDRQILVDRPDRKGRLAILEVHARSVKLAPNAKLETIAGMTPGMVGADLANVINEAALLAVRRGHEKVEQSDLEEAVERVIAGLEKKNRVLTKPERERVAHHEVGHALMALVLPGTDPVHKISIVPRGISALGYTLQLPTEERFLMTKTELENKIAVLMGGRGAEELVYGEGSTGAHDDLRKATDIAKRMVKEYGMSETIGTVTLDPPAPSIFLQQTESRAPGDYSEETAREVDREVRRVIDSQRRRVTDWLTDLKPVLLQGARLLLEKEVIAGEELQTLISKHRNVPLPVTSAPSPL